MSEANESITYLWRVPEWFPELGAEKAGKLQQLHQELIKFNRTVNLISSATAANADLVHFADCILFAKAILSGTQFTEIFDLASGNGFPGLILAILAPERRFVLVERDSRKVEYLKHAIGVLKLKNAVVESTNIESLGSERLTCAVARGYASITKSILTTRKLFKKDGEFYHMKGDGWSRELAEIPTQLCSFWQPILFKQYELPVKKTQMTIVLTKKIS